LGRSEFAKKVIHYQQSGMPLATLAGHTGQVGGALELTDGRLLSWASDGTLRLWDKEAGTLLATLAGHSGWVRGALELADGRLLSWAQDDTMLLWDKQSRTLLKAVSEKDAQRLRADWLAARAESHTPSLVQCGFVGWEEERVAGISPPTSACWLCRSLAR
jgi:WD40 repeat protein